MMQSPVLRRANAFIWLILLLCVVFTVLTHAGEQSAMLRHFLFFPPLIAEGEIWRIITPTFLHFSIFGSPIFHLMFNAVIWLNLAGWIAFLEPSWRLPALFFCTAIVANLAAYYTYGPAFGGLSGVVYGVIGYLWYAGRRLPIYRNILPTQSFFAFMFFLLLGYTGLIGNIANSAHLGGLIAGIVFAALLPPKFKASIFNHENKISQPE